MSIFGIHSLIIRKKKNIILRKFIEFSNCSNFVQDKISLIFTFLISYRVCAILRRHEIIEIISYFFFYFDILNIIMCERIFSHFRYAVKKLHCNFFL